jgi:hypothetical protein
MIFTEILNETEKEAYEKSIHTLTNIFDPLNEELCSNCSRNNSYNKQISGCCASCGVGHFRCTDDVRIKYPVTKKIGRPTKLESINREKIYSLRRRWEDDKHSLLDLQIEELKTVFAWKHGHGYFDPVAKKCMLPRELRSITCLEFRCDDMVKRLGKDNAVVDDCIKKIKEIRVKRLMLL